MLNDLLKCDYRVESANEISESPKAVGWERGNPLGRINFTGRSHPARRLWGFLRLARSHSGRYQGPAWAARKETQASRHTPVLASRRVRERPHKVSTGRGGKVVPVAPSESRHPVKPGTCKSLGQGRRTSRHPWRNYCIDDNGVNRE